MKKFILIMTCLLFVFTTGCKTTDDAVLINDDIKSKTNKDIDGLFDDIAMAIQNEELQVFLDLCVPGTEEINGVYFNEFMTNRLLYNDFFLEKNYQNLSRYHVKDINDSDITAEYVSDGYEFIIPDSDDSDERYIYIAEGKYNGFDIVFTVVFKNDDTKWQVEKFHLGNIRAYGQGITSLIEKAKLLEENGDLISAYMYNGLASELVYPSLFVKFKDENIISDSMARIADEINSAFAFPLDINMNDEESIQLYAVTSSKYPDGFYCRVSYVSNIKEEDATEETILAESKSLHENVKGKLSGLGTGFDGRILYTAYFEEPVTQGKQYKSITVSLSDQ